MWGLETESAFIVEAQGGNTTHAPCEFAGKLAAHDQGGGGQLLSDVSWRVRVPTVNFYLQVAMRFSRRLLQSSRRNGGIPYLTGTTTAHAQF